MYEVQVRRTEPLHVASIRHTGSYYDLGPVYKKLEDWLTSNKIRPHGFVREFGFDNPMDTPPEKCRQEVCVPVSESVATEAGVELKWLPEVQVISVVHKGGMDFQSIGPAYQALMGWAMKAGKQPGHSIITYYTPPGERQKAEIEVALVIA